MDPAPGSDSPAPSLSVLRASGLPRFTIPAVVMVLLPTALPMALAADPPAGEAASTERLPARSMGEPKFPAAAALVGLRGPMVLLKPGRRLCWGPASAESDARMRATCLSAAGGVWRSLRAALAPLPALTDDAAATAEADSRCTGFGVLLRCAAAAHRACCVNRDCAFSALLMRGADALLRAAPPVLLAPGAEARAPTGTLCGLAADLRRPTRSPCAGLALRAALPAPAGPARVGLGLRFAAAGGSMRLPNAHPALAGCAADGAERRTGDTGSRAGKTCLLLGTTAEPVLLRSLLMGEVAACAAASPRPLPVLPGAMRTVCCCSLVLPEVLPCAAAADSGLTGIILLPCEVSRMEALMDRRKQGPLLLLLPRPPAMPFGLAEVRSGGGGGASAPAGGEKPGSCCCCLAPPSVAACGR